MTLHRHSQWVLPLLLALLAPDAQAAYYSYSYVYVGYYYTSYTPTTYTAYVSIGSIVGAVIGALSFIGFVIGIIICVCCIRRRRLMAQQQQNQPGVTTMVQVGAPVATVAMPPGGDAGYPKPDGVVHYGMQPPPPPYQMGQGVYNNGYQGYPAATPGLYPQQPVAMEQLPHHQPPQLPYPEAVVPYPQQQNQQMEQRF